VPRLQPGSRFSRVAKTGAAADTRSKVLEYIDRNPGVHLRLIGRELHLAIGDVQYQTDRLEKLGAVTSLRRGVYRFFFSLRSMTSEQAGVMAVLSQSTPREIVLNLVSTPWSSQERLAQAVGVSEPTVSWHMKRLVKLGMVDRRQAGRYAQYRVTGDAAQIASLVRSYQPGVWEVWSDRLADMVLALKG
jgi:predicted transcriptional regulator